MQTFGAHDQSEVDVYRLSDAQIDTLVRLPETGMGYQLVEARVNDRRSRPYFVFNCELAVEPQELEEIGYFLPEERLSAVEVASTFESITPAQLSAMAPPTGGPGTPLGPLAPSPRIVRMTVDFEGFARVSAFPNDRRAKPDGSLESGTYATTVEDLRLVPSGFAAAGRYGLPNPAAARYVHIIVPGAGHRIDGGTVRPAHYQAGGGVEVLFVNGAPPGSVFRPYRIPEL